MPIRFGRSLAAAALLATAAAGPAFAADTPVKVVASFSILADLVAEVGGRHVEVTALVGPDGDAHVYVPVPADVRELAEADLVVVNGLGFEGWLDRLIASSGYAGQLGVAAEGIEPIEVEEEDHADEHAQGAEADAHAEGEGVGHAEEEGAEAHAEAEHHHTGGADPHAWQSVPNAKRYVANVADALCAVGPADCPDFRASAAAYTAKLDALDRDIRRSIAAVPPERRKVITSHDSLGYFAAEYGIEVLAPQGTSTESEASAADVAALIRQIRAEGVTALFVENMSDPRLIEEIGRETGVKPGGKLYSDALSGPEGPAATYIAMMRHNATLLANAMQGS